MSDISNDYGLFINSFFKKTDYTNGNYEKNTYYTLCIATQGEGRLNSVHVSYDLSKGDIFMIMPHHSCSIENVKDFGYISIGFSGSRGVELSKGLLDYVRTPVFSGYECLIDLWEDTLKKAEKLNNRLLAEGLLLYTLGSIPGKGILKGNYKKRESIMLQTYIHTNFGNPDLSLDTISKVFGYNKKYLSDLFKRKFDISFTEFLRNVRLENACSLMQLGITSVKKISTTCGFTDALYFSKVFKARYGMSPKEYISKMN